MAHDSKEKPARKKINLKVPNLKELLAPRRSIRGKMLFWLLLISLVPMIVIAWFSYRYSAASLQRQSFETLEATLAFQHQALQQYFTDQEKVLSNLANTMQVQQEESYRKLAAVKFLLKSAVSSYFRTRTSSVQAFGENPQQERLFSGVVRGGSAELDSALASFMLDWLKQRDFSSILLLSPAGKVLYSSDAEVKPGAAVLENSPEWRALQKGMQETSFADYGPSSFHADKAACYFSTPFKIEGQLAGVFLFRLKDDALDPIMKNVPGLGEQGEAYMVGADGMFRSNSVYFEEPTLANPGFIVDTESVVYALSGEAGEENTVNYRGDYVLSSYVSIDLHGATWVLIVEIDQAEAVAPTVQHEEEKAKGDQLQKLAATHGFPNLYLLNPDGHVFYAVKHQADYQTNILSGPFAGSGLAKTVGKVLEKKKLAVNDYSLYEPAEGRAAAFLAVPIMDQEEIVMIAAVQIPLDQINALMKIRQRFEEQSVHKFEGEMLAAETYLVGPDKLWRSEAADAKKYKVDKTFLNPKLKVDTEAVREALAGKDGTATIVNSQGESVLSSWSSFKYNDLTWAIISEVSEDEVHKPVRQLMWLVGGVAALAAVCVLVASLLVAGGVTRQVGAITKVMAKVEQGDYSERAEVVSEDELGRMASSFNSMTSTVQTLVKTRQEEHDKLNSSIIQLLEEITLLAEGDLTIRATVTDDVIGTLADSLNMMLDQMGVAFRRIKDSAEQVGSTANVLSASTGDLAQQNNAQSAMINEAMQKINLLTAAIRDAAAKADKSAGTSKESSRVAEDGAEAVRETSHAMEAIRGNVQNTARAIKRLGESSQEISDFARTINEISDRTSILALNASIQAAAAGEEGRGFAVVAEEIQRLAERAAASTRQIETLIRNILGEITEAGVSMDASIQEVVQGTKLSQNALAKLEEITVRSNEVAELIQGLAAVSKEQSETTARMSDTMKEIGSVSLETAEETMGASISMREMAAMGDDMLQAIAAFKLEKGASA